jgi:hypothetical protein
LAKEFKPKDGSIIPENEGFSKELTRFLLFAINTMDIFSGGCYS